MKLVPGARLMFLSGMVGAASGCLSMGTVQTASTLGRGNFQISAEPGIYGATGGPGGAIAQDPIPHFDVSFRYGVNDRFDLGVRTGWSLIELQTKFLLTAPEAEVLAISIAPTTGAAFLGGGSSSTAAATITSFNFAVPILFGIKHFRANELVFGPRFNNLIFAYGDGSGSLNVYALGVGATFGYAFAIGEIFKLLPEIAFNVPVAHTGGNPGTAVLAQAGFGGVIVQVKVGLLFGRSKVKPEPLPPPPPMPAPEPLTRPPELVPEEIPPSADPPPADAPPPPPPPPPPAAPLL